MSEVPPFTLTRESITVVWEGKPHTVQKTAPNFEGLRSAIMDEKWEDIPKHITVVKSIQEWANSGIKNLPGSGKKDFTFKDDTFYYKGTPIPMDLNDRIIAMATAVEDPLPLFLFWERLQKNPSFRSVQQLWGFLKKTGIPLTKDGYFLAYKAVNPDFTDVHSRKWHNQPGTVNEMPRNQISDDPQVACHEGFHVGSLHYASGFGPTNKKMVICKVDPEHVVCVPYDSDQSKMRVCKYKVVGVHNGQPLPSTTFVDGYCDEVNKEVPKEKEEESPERGSLKKGWAKYHKMSLETLLEQPLEDLRQYAGKGLDIVGASKIPGGKTALVKRIMEVRGD